MTSLAVYEDLLAPFMKSLDKIHAADVVSELRFKVVLSAFVASTNNNQ